MFDFLFLMPEEISCGESHFSRSLLRVFCRVSKKWKKAHMFFLFATYVMHTERGRDSYTWWYNKPTVTAVLKFYYAVLLSNLNVLEIIIKINKKMEIFTFDFPWVCDNNDINSKIYCIHGGCINVVMTKRTILWHTIESINLTAIDWNVLKKNGILIEKTSTFMHKMR